MLVKPYDFDALHTEISEMRVRVCDSLGTRAAVVGTAPNVFEATATFDLKHDVGDIVDAELTV